MNDDSHDKTRSALAIIAMVTLIILSFLGIYIAGYFWLGHAGYPSDGVSVLRVFPYKPMDVIYLPAAKIEGLCTGMDVRCTTIPKVTLY